MKLDMKDIMEQASASQDKQEKTSRGKISQKERKKQHHQSTQPSALQRSAPTPEKPSPAAKPTSPCQSTSMGPKVSLKEILGGGREQRSETDSPHLPILFIPSQKRPGTAGASSTNGCSVSSNGTLPSPELQQRAGAIGTHSQVSTG